VVNVGIHWLFCVAHSTEESNGLKAPGQRRGGAGAGTLTRHAVSLVRLPPPTESTADDEQDADECNDLANRLLHLQARALCLPIPTDMFSVKILSFAPCVEVKPLSYLNSTNVARFQFLSNQS